MVTRSTSENCRNECVVYRESTSSRKQQQGRIEGEARRRRDVVSLSLVGYWLDHPFVQVIAAPSFCLFTLSHEGTLSISPLPLGPLFQLEDTKRVSSLTRDQPSSIIINPVTHGRRPLAILIHLRPGCPQGTPPHSRPGFGHSGSPVRKHYQDNPSYSRPRPFCL